MIYIKNETEINFYEKIKSKKVICFGAGSNAHWIVNRYLIPENIVCFVDNFKAGTFIEINGREIDVISFEEIIIKLVNDSYDYIFVITTLKFSDEFILQLDNLGIFDGKIFYLPELLVPPNQEIIFDKNNSNIIQKKIHYCWFGHSEIPMQYKENIESWKKYCPDYEIIEWNENNYDITRNKYMFQAYQNKKWGFVPDYARIDIINTYGGIYLDLDVEIIKSFDYLLQFDMFCGLKIQ